MTKTTVELSMFDFQMLLYLDHRGGKISSPQHPYVRPYVMGLCAKELAQETSPSTNGQYLQLTKTGRDTLAALRKMDDAPTTFVVDPCGLVIKKEAAYALGSYLDRWSRVRTASLLGDAL